MSVTRTGVSRVCAAYARADDVEHGSFFIQADP